MGAKVWPTTTFTLFSSTSSLKRLMATSGFDSSSFTKKLDGNLLAAKLHPACGIHFLYCQLGAVELQRTDGRRSACEPEYETDPYLVLRKGLRRETDGPYRKQADKNKYRE
jgi:hypothetical protein